MNEGKVGEPYDHYPESFVQLLARLYVSLLHLAYRQTEGVVVKAHATVNKKYLGIIFMNEGLLIIQISS